MLDIGGNYIEYELTHKAVKNMNLRILADGRILVSVPCRISPAEADSFVLSRGDMILRAMNRRAEAEPLSDFYLGEGGRIPIFGRERRLSIREGQKRGATLYEERLELTVPDPESEEEIRLALRTELGRLAERCMPVVCEETQRRRMGYEIPSYTLRYRCMVGKWGSCCPSKQEITFNKFLICTPPECMEYVAIHEMAHFLVCDHSPAFHRLMDSLMPDWRERKKQLEPYAYLLRSL
jgi:predicted metal-dependent hydrolase